MTTRPLKIAIVYPGDSEIRRLATRENNRFAAVVAAFAARGVDARPAVYNIAQADELRDQLLECDGALVWVNPIDAGHSRAPLDALLRDVAAAGVMVSTHPDVIMKLGTKDVLVDTRAMGWGSDVHRLDTLDQLRTELDARLRDGSIRVLKQWRGHSGIGIWRVQRAPGQSASRAASHVVARHAVRSSPELTLDLDAFVALMAPYFEDGGHMVDQAWQPRLTEGMVRCYLVQDRVAGFGLQAVNALHPPLDGSEFAGFPTPSQRLYHPPDLVHLQGLKQRLESEWVPELERTLGIRGDELPLLWDCDFLFGERSRDGDESYVLCEINVSSVAPFPDSAIEPLVAATISRVDAARGSGRH
ncbi:MAG: Cj0069 family protein [Caldimonas sp.]